MTFSQVCAVALLAGVCVNAATAAPLWVCPQNVPTSTTGTAIRHSP